MWLLPSSLAYLCAQESPGSNVDSDLPCPDFGWSLTLSGKLTRRPRSWPGWKTRLWSQLLFGAATWRTSTPIPLWEWISSLPASPCQPASSAGRRRGTADQRWLWPEIARVVGAVEPRLVFLENVPGLLTVNAGDAFGEVVEGLAALGFDLEWDVFSATEVGAPHRRERLFLLAHRHSVGRQQPHYRPGDESRGLAEPDGSVLHMGHILAYRDRSGLGEFRLSGVSGNERTPCGHDADGRDQDVADANGRRLQRRRGTGELAGAPGAEQGQGLQRQRPGHAAGDGGADAGDPHGDGRREAFGRESAQGRSLASDPDVGDAIRADVALGESRPEPRAFPSPFPPSPADRHAWIRILAEHPDLAPALESSVRRVANGSAIGVGRSYGFSRSDHLRALGNGVVPLTAAVAFHALAERLGMVVPCAYTDIGGDK